MNIRLETKADYRQVEELTREAFWNLYVPGCEEHYLCHTLREHKDFIKDLNFVVELNNTIIASIMYTESILLSDDNDTVRAVSFGPLCVHPDQQRKGIGAALIKHTKSLVKDMNIPAIIIYGDPHNYAKHGFKNGIDYKVSNMDGEYPLGLLVLEVQQGFFGNKKWKTKQTDAFFLDHEKAIEFDQQFIEKEKKVTYSQELFKMIVRSYLR